MYNDRLLLLLDMLDITGSITQRNKVGAQRNLIFVCLVALANLVCKDLRESTPTILMQTDFGDIGIEVYLEEAPITAKNFLRYVDENRYRGGFFYRVVRLDNQPDSDVKIEVIQGGIGFGEGDLRLPPISHETTRETGILHKNGTISMARAEPGTASSEIFICVGDQPELDFGGRRNSDGQGFAAFGSVVKGMEVVRAIHRQPANGQMLTTPVKILGIKRLRKGAQFADSTVGEGSK